MADKTLQLKIITALQDRLSAPLKKIMGTSGQSAKSMADLRDKLKALERTQKDVGRFRELSSGLQKTRTEMQQAQDRVDGLARKLREAGPPTKTMTREFNQAVSASKRLKVEHQEQAQKLQALRDRLQTAGISSKSLATGERSLRANITSTNQALEQQKASLARVAQQQRKLGEARDRYQKSIQFAGSVAVGGAASAGAGTALLAPVKAVVDAFAPLEDASTQLRVSMMTTGGQVSSQFQQINDLAVRLGDRLPGTTADFLRMMQMLKRQGLSDQTILGGLGESAALMGVLLKLPSEQAAEYAAKMQDALRASESEMLKVTDGMQRMFFAGVDTDNILTGFAGVAPALDALGKSGFAAFQELGPLLAMFDQQKLEGASAGNALRKVFQRSIDSDRIEKANDALKDMGKSLRLDFTDGKGEFGGLEKMFAQLKQLRGLTSVQRGGILKELFGDNAETLQAVNIIMTKGIAGYNEMAQKMGDQASLNERVDAQLRTLQNVAEAASGNLTNAMAQIGASIAPALKEVLDSLGEIANRVGAWARANPELAGTITKVVAVLGGLLLGLGSLMIALAAIIGPFAVMRYGMSLMGIHAGVLGRVLGKLGASVLPLVGRAIAFIGRALMLNPIGLAVTAIAGAAYLIYKYWDPIKAFFSDLWDVVSAKFDAAVKGVNDLVARWSPLAFFRQAFDSVIQYLSVDLPAQFMSFGTMIVQGLVNGIKSMPGAVKDAVVNTAGSAVDWFKEKLGINSPSRVFMELGGFVTQGAALGIQRGQPLAEKAAQIMAAGVLTAGLMSPAAGQGLRFDTRPPITAQLGAGVGAAAAGLAGGGAGFAPAGGDHVEIHIHPAAGANPQDIARAVAHELDRRDREKRARARSALTDYGE